MAKYIDAECLKAKLDEHYRNYQSKYMKARTPYTQGLIDALDLAEQVIDTLESEKPLGLEEEIVKVCDDFVFPLYGLDDEFGRELINKIARHFYELGCTRTAEKYDEIEYNRQRSEESVQNDLEEAAKKHFKQEWSENYWAFEGDVINAFIAGAKWQKEQMMKETIEAEVVSRITGQGLLPAVTFLVDNSYKEGDKVRIIIVKED